MEDNLPEIAPQQKQELMPRPEPDKLPDVLRNFIDKYKIYKTITRACKSMGIDRYDIELALINNKNFESCMVYAEKEIQDELEYAVMAKAGFFGKEEYVAYKAGDSKIAFSVLKEKHSAYKGRSKSVKATQINANKVTINHSRS